MEATKFPWLTLPLPVMGRGWVKWLGILWMNSQILAVIWPYEHRREPFLCKGQNTTTRSSEASLRPQARGQQQSGSWKVLYRSEPYSTLRSTRDHEYSGLISTIWSSETANTGFAQPQPQDSEDRSGWSLILGNNYALAGGNIHCCTLFLSSWEPCLYRQLWIS